MLLDLHLQLMQSILAQVAVAVLIAAGITTLVTCGLSSILGTKVPATCPISVNYHFTRRCNKSCGFCFHTAKTSHREPLDRAKAGLRLLARGGMRKLNFAGGEPFYHPSFLGALVEYAKKELRLESVSIVSNGSLITKDFMDKYARYLDILAISCDSFNEATNIEIGRGSGDQVTKLYQIKDWCQIYDVLFKINTVVCALNHMEDMNVHIEQLNPFRWKCFQVLMVEGENDSESTLRNVNKFLISDDEYEAFCRRHEKQEALVKESNKVMAKSYLILDEYLRFLDRDGKEPSGCILDVGVQAALKSVYWDKESFAVRGGVFAWNLEQRGGCGGSQKDMEW